MKTLMQLVLIFATFVTPVFGVSGVFATGSLRGTSTSGQLAVGGSMDARASAAPPSCQVFVEMLGRVYYLRDQLNRTTKSLTSIGYTRGQEWVIDQGIGNATPATLPNIVCPLLANTSDAASSISLLARHIEAPPTDAKEESSGWLPIPEMPDWLTGSSEPKPTPKEGATSDGASSKEGAAEPVVNKSQATSQGAEAASAEESAQPPGPAAGPAPSGPKATGPPATPEEAGCPAGSPQKLVLTRLRESFDGIDQENEALPAIKAIYQDLMLSIEKGVMSLYNYRGCPAVTQHEFKTRHVCEMHREEQSSVLRMLQTDLPQMRSRLFALQSRLKKIDSGTSRECFFTQRTKPPMPPAQANWCLEVQAVIDALLDGRAPQKEWLNSMGAGMQQLGIMSMQLNRLIQEPVLKRDKIPLNALKALTNSWKHLESPTQQLRVLGSTFAKQALSIDGLVLQLSSFLQNVSAEEHCVTEGFRMRYSAKTCASLRHQLSAAVEERQTDMQGLQQRAREMMETSSAGLIANKCTAPPMTAGCWLRLPTGCPNLPAWKSADKWTRDIFGEESTGAAENQVVCSVSRKIQMDNFCGVANAEMRFITAAQL